jgi:hypothetical protein
VHRDLAARNIMLDKWNQVPIRVVARWHIFKPKIPIW